MLVDLVVDGEEHLAIRVVDPARPHPPKWVHVDFLAVSRTETITVSVPVHEMVAAGVKEGSVVEHHLREVQIECLPQDVPDEIVVDITDVELGDMVHVSDLAAGRRHDPHEPRDAVLSVVTPAALRVEADLSVPGEEGVEVPVAEVEEGVEVPAAEVRRPRSGEAAAEGGWRGLDPLPLV